jgi:hypothetical protein
MRKTDLFCTFRKHYQFVIQFCTFRKHYQFVNLPFRFTFFFNERFQTHRGRRWLPRSFRRREKELRGQVRVSSCPFVCGPLIDSEHRRVHLFLRSISQSTVTVRVVSSPRYDVVLMPSSWPRRRTRACSSVKPPTSMKVCVCPHSLCTTDRLAFVHRGCRQERHHFLFRVP